MLPDLRQQEQQLADYIRRPDVNPPPPGMEARRLRIYRELFFNNVLGLLSGMFPVMRQLLAGEEWQRLVRDFYAQHRCDTPYFPCIGQEFIAWLQGQAELSDDRLCLPELAHFEWVELALSIADENWPPADASPHGDVLAGVPRVSPLCWSLCYQYPVHRIGSVGMPVQAAPVYLLAYRDEADAFHVVESNAASIQLMEILRKNHSHPDTMPITGEQALLALSQAWQQADPHLLLSFGRELLLTWQSLGIIAVTECPA